MVLLRRFSPFPGKASAHPETACARNYRADERVWLRRIRAGDEGAFEALFSAYYSSLCVFVRGYVGAADLAEELVQNVFLRIWERRATWSPSRGIRAYLFAACRNEALDHVKHERVVARARETAVREGRAPGLGQVPSRPDEEAQASELSAALHREVRELPERRRIVFVLRWRDRLSHAEIGRLLGVSAKCAETQFGRAMATLRERLAHFQT